MKDLPITKQQRIGMSIGGNFTIDELPRILERIAQFKNIKFIEIDVDIANSIIAGKLNKQIMRELKKVLSQFPFGYTVHRAKFYDLRDIKNVNLNRELFLSCLEFTKEIDATVYVDHFMQKSDNKKTEAIYEESLHIMAEKAKEYDVIIGLENIEIDYFQNTINCIEKINHPNLKMTMDFGHTYLTAKYFGEDFLDNIKKAKPHLCHIHIHDNTGDYDADRLLNKQKSLAVRLPLGKGDLHLPIGWGNIPFKEAFEIIGDDYSGIYMLEHEVGVSECYMNDIIDNLIKVI